MTASHLPPAAASRLAPPGVTEEVHAASALVVAPHPDDEVLGCGGLVARLAAAGAVVRVLFLSDGGGGEEPVENAAAYRTTRREEAARAAVVLGLAGVEHLDLPDGSLAFHLGAVATRLRRALLTQRPELLLVPSPLEVSADHRATFAAVHRLLSPVRAGAPGPEAKGSSAAGDDPLVELLRTLRVLVYEVNQPAHPDLLVDVTPQLPRIAQAMGCYPSQQARHDYLGAALGLRRFRTLTLPAEGRVEAVEGYRRLTVADFTTRSLAQLVAHLGGVPELLEVREGPRVSVVVRTLDRPVLLAEALESLAAGTYRPAQVVLVNDGGAPPAVPAGYPLEVLRVDLPATAGRAAAAQAGVEAAAGDWIAFLDDDDLAAPEHLATLVGAARATGAPVVYSDACVAVCELTARGWQVVERRLPYSRDFDPDLLLVDNYIPFNTLLMTRELLEQVGPFDRSLPFFEDWDLLIRLARVARFHHLRQVTCDYRHFRGAGHHVFGERPRERGDFLTVKARVLAKHSALASPEGLARAVDTLRTEGVEAQLELDEKHRQLVDLTAGHRALAVRFAELEDRFHREHGELEARRQEREQMTADLDRLYRDEAALRRVVEDQNQHLARTYAEIQRLEGLLAEMRATRAWRFHEWLQRRGPSNRPPRS